jgi:YgiT-type zinc finger domain-containing protein
MMICTNCFKEEYKAAKTELSVTINCEARILGDLDCEKCPDCGDITFTHAQSLEINKKRIALEGG